jgi:hypothetical protein
MSKKFITVLECVEVTGFCPIYKVGSKVVIDECLVWRTDHCLVRYRAGTAESANCYPFLVDVAPYFRSLCRGVPPKALGIAGADGHGYVTCKNLPVKWFLEHEYYTHGNVTFRIQLLPTDQNYNDQFDDDLRQRDMPPYGRSSRMDETSSSAD